MSRETRSGLPSLLLYASDLVFMAPTMEQLVRRVAEWRVSLLYKGLMVNSGKSKVVVGSSGGKMIVNSRKRSVMLLFAFLDLCKEMGATLKNCPFHHTRLESLEYLIVVCLYHSRILSSMILFLDLKDSIFSMCVCGCVCVCLCTFPLFFASTLCMYAKCLMSLTNVILLMIERSQCHFDLMIALHHINESQ